MFPTQPTAASLLDQAVINQQWERGQAKVRAVVFGDDRITDDESSAVIVPNAVDVRGCRRCLIVRHRAVYNDRIGLGSDATAMAKNLGSHFH